MANLFSDAKKLFSGSSKLTWMQVLIFGLIPLGQLWARIFYFNGSLDKLWMLFPLFLIPPFSFIPLILMKYGFIANGKGSNPLDYWMIIPIVAKFIISFIIPFIIDEESQILTILVSFVLQLLTIMIANLGRRHVNCKSITVDSIGKAGIDSTIAHAAGDLTTFIIPFLPFIGLFFTIIEMIPIANQFVESIVWSIGFILAYVLINMFNQQKGVNDFCSIPFAGKTSDKVYFFGSIIIIIGINAFNILSE